MSIDDISLLIHQVINKIYHYQAMLYIKNEI